ncbi:hypothetical protein HOF92_00170 [bacterium]|jgi:hypothetical protein|nr:hypothetical protein [bacterium]
MVAIYQIFVFYLILGLVTSAILGFYPHMEPDTFASLGIFQNHPRAHVLIAKGCLFLLAAAQFLAMVQTIAFKSALEKGFLNSSQDLFFLRKSRTAFKVAMVAFILGILLCLAILFMGTQAVGNSSHSTQSLILLALACISLLISGWGMQTLHRSKCTLERGLGILIAPEKFIWDEHARIYSIALKFLFLGINVWWPYLVLRYGLGLKLNALVFLPVHLCGVMPYSFLKRKHKFNRTINPKFQGKIKKREKYILSPLEKQATESLQT